MLKTRVISAVILVAVIGACLISGGLVWWALLLFISIIGFHEFCMAIRKVGEGEKYEMALPELAGYLCTVAYYIVLLLGHNWKYMMFSVVVFILIYMVLFVGLFPEYGNDRIMQDFFGFLYVPLMISFMYLIRIREKGIIEMLLVFISAWICDTFAYFTGMLLGRHKLAPVLSPKKSIEGSVGGTVASALFGGLLGYISGGNILFYAVFTGVGAVIAQFGDLFASGIKRNQGIKDYGKLIPGHGGILDRFDSIIIVAPVIYILCELWA